MYLSLFPADCFRRRVPDRINIYPSIYPQLRSSEIIHGTFSCLRYPFLQVFIHTASLEKYCRVIEVSPVIEKSALA